MSLPSILLINRKGREATKDAKLPKERFWHGEFKGLVCVEIVLDDAGT